MKIEVMIYAYIAICASMILYNTVYIFVLRHRKKALERNSKAIEEMLQQQMNRIEIGLPVTQEHNKYMRRALQKTALITAFDKAMERVFQEQPDLAQEYLMQTYDTFEYLTHRYISKDTLKIAYFPYMLQKYDILQHDTQGRLLGILFELLRSVNVYCRENTLKAIYSTRNAGAAARALWIIDKNLSFHHPKLICDGLLGFKGDREQLRDELLKQFNMYSTSMQLNILNYFRFSGVRCDESMLNLLKAEGTDRELRFSAIRYFEKFPCEQARELVQDFAENSANRDWEYQAIASSALKSYPDDVTFRILVHNLSNSNWHIRHNSAISCEKLGYTYHDLISVFDGDDRYAREILRYRLDRRKAEEMAVKV